MINTRTLRITDDLKQVAQDLVDYILKSHEDAEQQKRHKVQLQTVMDKVGIAYNQPFSSWWYILYQFYRQRSQEIIATQQMLRDAPEQLLILDILAGFLQKGGCDSTSANTILLNDLIQKLDKYEALEVDIRFSTLGESKKNIMLMGIRIALRDLFVTRAKETLKSYADIAEADMKMCATPKPARKKLRLDESMTKKLESIFLRVDYAVKVKRDAMREGAIVLSRPQNGFAPIDDYNQANKSDDYKPVSKINFAQFHMVTKSIEERYGKKSVVKNEVPVSTFKVGKVSDTYKESVMMLSTLFGKKKPARYVKSELVASFTL